MNKRLSLGGCLLALVVMLVSGCVIGPREGYYDHAHHRYWHNHGWHACVQHDVHCR
jgi:hypothetical protein